MDLRYSKEHEWIAVDGDIATIGVTEYAAGEMGDVVFLELPEEGSDVSQGDPVGTIETVKSVEDLYCPLTGEITEINEGVLDTPELVNQDPLEDGWLFRVKLGDPSELDSLLDAAGYNDLIGG
ncbi:glycine cleavage system protein GcvH [bacterium]|jgi:glycine cleavage system H protein|nr:glycine cleavage system protein GcvH [bacterium]